MRLSQSSITRLGTVLLMVVIIPACTPLRLPSVPLDTNTVKPIPLTAKFYISPEFRETAYTPIQIALGMERPVLVGETIENGVNDVVEYAFRESGEISSIEGDLSNRGFDILVIPEITLLELKHGSQLWFGRSSAILQIRWKIEDTNGNLLWSDTITAAHNSRCYKSRCFSKLMEKTIKEQFQQALEKMTGYDWWN